MTSLDVRCPRHNSPPGYACPGGLCAARLEAAIEADHHEARRSAEAGRQDHLRHLREQAWAIALVVAVLVVVGGLLAVAVLLGGAP